MISRLRGTLLTRDLERVEVMTVGGIAYEVWVPLPALERLPRAGEEVELRTYQVVREDSLTLYGFPDEAGRTVFARLLTAPGVGPRLALALVSALSPAGVVRAVRDRNTAALTAVSGVGKKTAERLILDLGGKLDDIPVAAIGRGPAAPAAGEAVRALIGLGLAAGEAERTVAEVVAEEGALPAADLVRSALARAR
ncbi:Holliday junction branch migration protein RuvA [soil metagenome]